MPTSKLVGTIREVFHGKARQTAYGKKGLRKNQLRRNKQGKIVTIKSSAALAKKGKTSVSKGMRAALDNAKKGKTKMKKKKGVAMKEEKVNLFGGITVKQGALHNQLKTKAKFGKTALNRLAKIEIGKMFEFRGNKFKMTGLMKKRIGLAKAFAGMKKK